MKKLIIVLFLLLPFIGNSQTFTALKLRQTSYSPYTNLGRTLTWGELDYNFINLGDALRNLQATSGSGNTFTADVVVISDGTWKAGKYGNGQTIPLIGKTPQQAFEDMFRQYISPSFSSFQISGQPSVVEVGTTLSGLKTFTWGVSVNSGVVPTIDIYNNNTLANLVTATANDGSEAATITSIQLNSNGASQSWKGVGNNTSPVGTFSSGNFTVTSRFYRWSDAVATSLTTSASVRALTQTDFYYGGGTYQLQTGSVQKKFVIALPTGVSIVSVFDLDALGADITSSYVLQASINVVDAGGTNRAYNIYEMNISSAYTSNHRHSITIN